MSDHTARWGDMTDAQKAALDLSLRAPIPRTPTLAELAARVDALAAQLAELLRTQRIDGNGERG